MDEHTGLASQSGLGLFTCFLSPRTLLTDLSEGPLGWIGAFTLLLSSFAFCTSLSWSGLMVSKALGRPARSLSLLLLGLVPWDAWCLMLSVFRNIFKWSGGQSDTRTCVLSGMILTVHLPSFAKRVKSWKSRSMKFWGALPSWTRRTISWNSFRPNVTVALRMSCRLMAWPAGFKRSTATMHWSSAGSMCPNILPEENMKEQLKSFDGLNLWLDWSFNNTESGIYRLIEGCVYQFKSFAQFKIKYSPHYWH